MNSEVLLSPIILRVIVITDKSKSEFYLENKPLLLPKKQNKTPGVSWSLYGSSCMMNLSTCTEGTQMYGYHASYAPVCLKGECNFSDRCYCV